MTFNKVWNFLLNDITNDLRAIGLNLIKKKRSDSLPLRNLEDYGQMCFITQITSRVDFYLLLWCVFNNHNVISLLFKDIYMYRPGIKVIFNFIWQCFQLGESMHQWVMTISLDSPLSKLASPKTQHNLGMLYKLITYIIIL